MFGEAITRQLFDTDDVIFYEGEPADRAYIVEAGRVSVFKQEASGRRAIGQLGPGAIFGEMALVDDRPRMATAIATEHTTVIIVPRRAFRVKLAAADPFIGKLLRLLNDNVRKLQNEITELRNAATRTRDAPPQN